MDNLKIIVQAVLDKIKSRNNIKDTLKELEALPLVVKITGILNASKTKSEIKKALKEIESGTDSAIKVKTVLENKESLKQIKNAISELDTKIDITADDKQLKSTSESLDDVNKRSLATVVSLRLMQEAMRGLEQASHEMISTAFNLNKQLTDLRLVTRDNYEDAEKTVHAYNDLAHELSSLTSQVLSASNDWLRQGKSVEETTELITQSIILSKVGAMAAEDATKNLTSAMKGYKLEVGDVAGIVDKLTSIDLEAAASSSGLAEAMSRTASGAAIAGIEMDKLLGYLATVIEVTQKAPSSIGESFKTIFARMGNVKLGKFLDDDGEDISDVESILKHFGITLRDTKNEFREFGVVLDDVSNQWSSYTDLEKRAIANAFAGVRQYENFLVLMENYGTAIHLAGVAADSAGTSLERFAIYEDGLEAKTNQLKNALESLSFNTLDAGFTKTLIDAGTATVKLVDNLNLLKSTLIMLSAIGASKGISAITNSAKSLYNQVNQLNSAFNLMAGFSKASLPTEQFNQLIVATNGLNMSQMRLILTNKALDDTQRVNLLTSRGLTEAEARQTLATLGLANAESTATTATGFLTGAFK